MDQQELYDGTMLDIDPILEDFPMELYEGSPVSEGTSFDQLEGQMLLPIVEPQEQEEEEEDGSMMSPPYGDFIDPDMFLNGVVKRESESDCSTSSHRNTPSPSDSNKSFDSYPSSGYESCRSAQINNILFDSPPTSPENPSSPPQIVAAPKQNVIRVGTAQLPAIQRPHCQTNTAELKKIKLPPKGTTISTHGTSSGLVLKPVTKKTIVLTAKDYQALMKNMKNNATNGAVLIKATPASAFVKLNKDKPVLPKPTSQPKSHVASPQTIVSPVQEVRSEPAPVVTAVAPQPAPQVPRLLPRMEPTVDERVLKKHQRMIKNRESAYLSRVRKKEYVTCLEQQIDDLTKENHYLKNENTTLLEKLKLKCSCGATSVSSFGTVNNVLTKQLSPNVRKNTAIVLAMVFMVSFNFGPLGNLLTNSISSKAALEAPPDMPHHKRNLLWVDNSDVFNVARNVDISLNLTNFDDLSRSAAEEPFSVCPFYVNQTENIRLASELRRWIGENGFKNLTDRDGDDMSISSFSEMFALKDTIDSMYQQMKDISSQMESFQKRNKLAAGSAKKRPAQFKARKKRDVQIYQQKKASQQSNELSFYYPGFSKKYAKFFEEIGRRDDTFYLVSFSGEHLLLPALAYNKTNRPKMSLMLPAMVENSTHHPTDKVTLMQIDCEVMNTSMIQIREKNIPGDLLRTHKPEDGFAPKEEGGASTKKTNNHRPSGNEQFHANEGQNVTRSATGGGSGKTNGRNKQQQQHASRPFFVQRMNDHMKNELDLH